VGDDQRGAAELLLEVRLEPFDAGEVEVVGGLVEEQQFGVAQQQAREGQARALAAAEDGDGPRELVAREAQPHQRGLGSAFVLVAAGVLELRLQRAELPEQVMARVRLRFGDLALQLAHPPLRLEQLGEGAQRGVVQAHLRGQVGLLLHEADAQALAAVHAAGVGLRGAGDDPQQRRLARPVRPDQADRLALVQAERGRIEHAAAGEHHADFIQRYQGHWASLTVV